MAAIGEALSAKYNCSFSFGFKMGDAEVASASGIVDFSTGRRATTGDRYPWGSVTKVLTGSSVLRLVSEGAFGMDDPVAPLVDPLIARMAAQNPDQGFGSVADLWGAAAAKVTTVRQLLGMTSGVPDFDTAKPCMRPGCAPTDPLRATLYSDPNTSWAPTRLMNVPWVKGHFKKCKSMVPWFPAICYSSTNFMLLGLVLAAHAHATSWESFDQTPLLPKSLQGRVRFALKGAPKDYTPVHGYDRTSYNVPAGQKNNHDNWEVAGTFSGWTASDLVGTAADIAALSWEVYGPPHAIAPKSFVDLMIPTGPFYGLATFNLSTHTGQTGKFGRAYGHLGATYGYQSILVYFPGLQFAMAVATNLEIDDQAHPADAICQSYNAIAGVLMDKAITCQFSAGSYYGGKCSCDHPIVDKDMAILI
eukprot:CAMPEP_0168387010 /NCGR_PEP_ID=MMETSP0228-20121227/15724_1 /TAXON_ID=133427 /ORGANISM="Protoceratium reticulatum, Strain CCCM 535 (=CCMP 1889)" /LENGTH=417 /DNA_ID=CAMNT_0008400231 /DNA_START=56 /DNA_END=1309 /DNA_ORIENTATION=+